MIWGYVYVMRGVTLRSKIGITKYPYARQRNVDKTTRGDIRIVVCYRFVFPRFVEGLLHTVFSAFRTRVNGSGGTEYFWLPYPITAFILTLTWFISLLLSILSVFFCIILYQSNGSIDNALEKILEIINNL